MNILVTGASGFVGSMVVNNLLKSGYQVTCCVRNAAYTKRLFPHTKIIPCDFTKDTSVNDWLPRLEDIDVVINTVGIFYHPVKKVIWLTHFDVPRALFDACVQVNIKKIIHLSALNVDVYKTDYAKSKLAADLYLKSLPITSIILRPSLIYGQGSYGGSSLFRGLAGLPVIIPLPNGGKQELQPIHLSDLSLAIIKLLEKPVSTSSILNAVCKEKIQLRTMIQIWRQWLTFSEAKFISLPRSLLFISSLFGNFIPNSVINSTAFTMLSQNSVSSQPETNKFVDTIEFSPRSFAEGVFLQPSTVQDKWHARLYFIKSFLQLSLAFLWIFTALCSMGLFPISDSYQLLAATGIPNFWQPLLLYGAAGIDCLIGLALLFNFQIKKVCVLQALIIFIYSLIITCKLPIYWLHPFGPLTKNIPLLISIYILYVLDKNK